MAFNQLRRIIFSFVFFSFICPMVIDAYPYAYRRLVLKKEGKIVKVVDLISDVHMPELECLRQMKASSFSASKPKQGPSEKALFATLQKLVQKPSSEGMEIFGESAPESIERKAVKAHYWQGFMWLTLYKLYKKIERLNLLPEKKQRYTRLKHPIINRKPMYTHADTYRFTDPDSKNWKGRIRSYHPEDFLDAQNPIDRDMINLKNIIDAHSYQMLEKLWQKFKQCIQCYCAPHSSSELRKCFADYETIDLQYETKSSIKAKAMDFEVLMKILKSQNAHNIVLAGGAHCYQLESWLTEEFGFEEIFSFGPKQYTFTCWNEFKPLPVSIWKHLESDPFSPQTAAAA